jgi:hypothetical protein
MVRLLCSMKYQTGDDSMEETKVEAGQVWEDYDPRMRGRRFRVIEVLSNGCVACRNLKTDRLSYIGLHRFKPGRDGYKLVDLQQEEYIKSISPMDVREIKELLTYTLHGPPPQPTLYRMFATLGAHIVALERISELEAEIKTMKEVTSA